MFHCFFNESNWSYCFNRQQTLLRSMPDYILTPSASAVNFTNVLCAAFTLLDPEKVKKIDNLTVFFKAFGICKRKSCMQNVDEIEPLGHFQHHFMSSFCTSGLNQDLSGTWQRTFSLKIKHKFQLCVFVMQGTILLVKLSGNFCAISFSPSIKGLVLLTTGLIL